MITARTGTARTLSCLPLLGLLALTAASPRSQQIAAGLDDQVVTLPPAASLALTLDTGEVLYFDGHQLRLQVPNQPPVKVLALQAPAFGSFLLAVRSGQVLFGENSTGALWLVPLQGPAPSVPLCHLPLNYDAVMLSNSKALVSAKTGGWPSPTNELVVVDLPTGQTWVLASLPGPSGAVAIAANGDVFYTTATAQFPPPPGLVSILRFPRPLVDLAIQNQQPLTQANAQVVMTGIDAAGDMCFDDDDDLLFVDWMNNQIGELNDATGPAPWLGAPLVAYGVLTGATTLQFDTGAGTGVFEPFQPTHGQLHVHETDYFSSSAVRSLFAVQAELGLGSASPVATGNFTLQASQGPAGGFGILVIAFGPGQGSFTVGVAGFEQPIVWNLALLNSPISWPLDFDNQGQATLNLVNPGFTPIVPATSQAAFVSTAGVLGATAAITFQFGT